MHPTVAVVLVNLMIVSLAVAVLVFTKNPLALLALLMLRDIPMLPTVFGNEEEEDEDGGKIGFVTD